MEFEWDETKNQTNKLKHHVGFELTGSFDWQRAIIQPDVRWDYGEDRFLARGYTADGAGYSIVFTFRGSTIRVISVRPFNTKEYLQYGKRVE